MKGKKKSDMLTYLKTGEILRLEVEDKSKGIAAMAKFSEKRKIFRAFDEVEQAKAKEEHLGLSLALKKIEFEFADVKAKFQGDIRSLRANLGLILEKISHGGEDKELDVYAIPDYERGIMEFILPDGEKIDERPMSAEERQGDLGLSE